MMGAMGRMSSGTRLWKAKAAARVAREEREAAAEFARLDRLAKPPLWAVRKARRLDWTGARTEAEERAKAALIARWLERHKPRR